MSDKYARISGQGEDFLDARPQRACASAWKVRTGCAAVGHEDRIVHERRVTDRIGYRCKRVARRKHDAGRDAADGEGVAVNEQPVPLTAIDAQIRPIVDLRPDLLDIDNSCANGDWRTRNPFEIGCSRQMPRRSESDAAIVLPWMSPTTISSRIESVISSAR